jgi:hypothetical protein
VGESPWKFESSWPHQTVQCILHILRLRRIGGRNAAIPGSSGGSGTGTAVGISGLGTESSSRASSEGGWRPSTMAVMMSPDPSCTADENDQCCSGGCCQLLAACFNSADGSMPISTPFSGRLLVAITQQVRAPSCCAIRRSPFYWLLSDRFRRTSRSPLPAEADADTSAGGTFYR